VLAVLLVEVAGAGESWTFLLADHLVQGALAVLAV
jgi:hypothetical protein